MRTVWVFLVIIVCVGSAAAEVCNTQAGWLTLYSDFGGCSGSTPINAITNLMGGSSGYRYATVTVDVCQCSLWDGVTSFTFSSAIPINPNIHVTFVYSGVSTFTFNFANPSSFTNDAANTQLNGIEVRGGHMLRFQSIRVTSQSSNGFGQFESLTTGTASSFTLSLVNVVFTQSTALASGKSSIGSTLSSFFAITASNTWFTNSVSSGPFVTASNFVATDCTVRPYSGYAFVIRSAFTISSSSFTPSSAGNPTGAIQSLETGTGAISSCTFTDMYGQPLIGIVVTGASSSLAITGNTYTTVTGSDTTNSVVDVSLAAGSTAAFTMTGNSFYSRGKECVTLQVTPRSRFSTWIVDNNTVNLDANRFPSGTSTNPLFARLAGVSVITRRLIDCRRGATDTTTDTCATNRYLREFTQPTSNALRTFNEVGAYAAAGTWVPRSSNMTLANWTPSQAFTATTTEGTPTAVRTFFDLFATWPPSVPEAWDVRVYFAIDTVLDVSTTSVTYEVRGSGGTESAATTVAAMRLLEYGAYYPGAMGVHMSSDAGATVTWAIKSGAKENGNDFDISAITTTTDLPSLAWGSIKVNWITNLASWSGRDLTGAPVVQHDDATARVVSFLSFNVTGSTPGPVIGAIWYGGVSTVAPSTEVRFNGLWNTPSASASASYAAYMTNANVATDKHTASFRSANLDRSFGVALTRGFGVVDVDSATNFGDPITSPPYEGEESVTIRGTATSGASITSTTFGASSTFTDWYGPRTLTEMLTAAASYNHGASRNMVFTATSDLGSHTSNTSPLLLVTPSLVVTSVASNTLSASGAVLSLVGEAITVCGFQLTAGTMIVVDEAVATAKVCNTTGSGTLRYDRNADVDVTGSSFASIVFYAITLTGADLVTYDGDPMDVGGVDVHIPDDMSGIGTFRLTDLTNVGDLFVGRNSSVALTRGSYRSIANTRGAVTITGIVSITLANAPDTFSLTYDNGGETVPASQVDPFAPADGSSYFVLSGTASGFAVLGATGPGIVHAPRMRITDTSNALGITHISLDATTDALLVEARGTRAVADADGVALDDTELVIVDCARGGA